jgi:tetratricopeptide (TPR) repeat protein
LFISVAALATLLACGEAIKIAAVTALAKSADVTDLEKALAWDPANPVLHSRLSELYSDSTDSADLTKALDEARRAIALNPNRTEYWLNLASTCESVRDINCSDQAFDRALALSPMTPQVWWAAGDHYLRTDRQPSALRCFHRLLALSPDYAAQTFDLTLRAYGDPQLILASVVGNAPAPSLLLAFTDFMSANDQLEAAHQAWAELAGGAAHFSFAAIQPYVERLLAHGRYLEAQSVWSGLEAHGAIAQPAASERGNLVFNGGFEQPPLGAGFDWRAQPSAYVSVDFTDASPYEGAHCLRLDFPVADNDEFEPVVQIVPVAPNQSYTLAAYVRTRDIASDSGPRLRVTDPACATCLSAATDSTVGSTDWHKVAVRFATGSQTPAVRVSVWRPRSRVFPMEISGSFWLDAVSLRADPQ